jgi:hypothetical protein
MAEQGAPLIKRYLDCNYQEGYIYVIIENKDDEAVYTESLEFDKFENMEMCYPY